MALVQIPEALLKYTNGISQLNADLDSLDQITNWLKTKQGSLASVLLTPDGNLCGYVNLYLDGQLVSDKINQAINISENSNIDIVAAVSGG